MADDHENKKNTNGGEPDADRRRFIKNTGLVAGGVVGGSLFGGYFGNMTGKDKEDDKKTKDKKAGTKFREARQFFSRKEDFDVLTAAVERIYPKDDNGPGATELGVPFYIDAQLAGEYGLNAVSYMGGPYKKVKSSERYQTRLNRGEIMILGLRALNDAGKQKDKEGFSKLEGKEQDKILTNFEKGKGKITGLSSDMFFELLRQMTIEGCYCDPLYGGNRDMAGWKMREFPGAHPAYINDIDSKEFVKMDPISLEDYQP